MQKFLSVFFSVILCLSLFAGLLCEGLYFGIQSTLTEKAQSNSYRSELERKTEAPGANDASNTRQAIDMLRATEQEIDELNLRGVTLDDTTLTVVGLSICDMLDSCGVKYNRSTIMGIMGDVRDSGDFRLFLYELVVKLVNEKVYTDHEMYTVDELIEVCENNKDVIESFFQAEFKKYDVDFTQSLLDKIAQKYEELVHKKIDLSIDDKYVFTHLIEALIRAFRQDISDKIKGYMDSVQAEVADYIRYVLDGAEVEYDPNIVNDIAYDVVNSKKMIRVVQNVASRVLGAFVSGKENTDLAGEIQAAIRENEKDINDFVREILKKYDLGFTEESVKGIDNWWHENLGVDYTFDPNDPKVYSELLANYVGSDINAALINRFQDNSKDLLDELYGRVPQPVIQAVAYLMSPDNMARVRTIYILTAAGSALIALLASVPKCLIFRSIGISGIFSGLMLAGVYLGTRVALPRIDGENVELIRLMVDNLGKRELTIGIIAGAVGIASMIVYSVMYSSYLRTQDVAHAHPVQTANAAPAAAPATEPAAPAEEQAPAQAEESAPEQQQAPEQASEPEPEPEQEPEAPAQEEPQPEEEPKQE